MTLLDQLPRFSEYDPGAVGEGSLDPLGFGALADRIADRLAPGVRARMSQPRFVTLAAAGAFACEPISSVVATDGKTTFDLAFEWLVVEALVQNPTPDRLRGLPGSGKAQRAAKMKERLSASTYLAGPRVFGFTGVYRPFSQDTNVLAKDGRPGMNAEGLIRAWEQDQHLSGFVNGVPESKGARVRREIEKECLAALQAGHVTAPPTGWLMKQLADAMAPREAGSRERAELRKLITTGNHEIRNELTAILSRQLPAAEATEQEIARDLAATASTQTRIALNAAIEFETCATAIEYAFRRLLYYASSLGGVFSVDQALETPTLAELAPRLEELRDRAVEAVSKFDVSLANEVTECFATFAQPAGPSDLVHSLVARHQQVQEQKGKRMWLDPVKGSWVVRPPYRNQPSNLVDDDWTHPMRLHTLVSFLRATE